MTHLKKSDLILLLLNGDNKYPITGITRFQKLVFLTQKKVSDESNTRTEKFDFYPHKFGPFCEEVYDELNFLKSVGMIKEGNRKKYEITDKGIRFLEKKTFERVGKDMQEGIENIKKNHGREDLKDLLKYVYINYPDFIVKSEILGRVLEQ